MSEMVVINVFCDPKEEIAVSEHLSHVDNMLCGYIYSATVILQNIISFTSVIRRDLQCMLVKKEDRSPDIPVVDHKVKEVVIQLSNDLGNEKTFIMVCSK